jgi:hypothetical protein
MISQSIAECEQVVIKAAKALAECQSEFEGDFVVVCEDQLEELYDAVRKLEKAEKERASAESRNENGNPSGA